VKCREFFFRLLAYDDPGGVREEAWQIPNVNITILSLASIANISFSMQSEHIHLWGFIKIFQLSP